MDEIRRIEGNIERFITRPSVSAINEVLSSIHHKDMCNILKRVIPPEQREIYSQWMDMNDVRDNCHRAAVIVIMYTIDVLLAAGKDISIMHNVMINSDIKLVIGHLDVYTKLIKLSKN